MHIGIGLPATIPGIPARLMLEWAAEAERGRLLGAAIGLMFVPAVNPPVPW
jgi:hypothetical protein